MSEALQPLFEAVRAACFPATWSRGVELTRADAVVQEQIDDDEAAFRVSQRGGMISPKVSLYLDDLDCDCECPSREKACAISQPIGPPPITANRAGSFCREKTVSFVR